MALTACRECGQQVSTEAVACPHCGVPATPAPETRSARRSLVIVAAVILLVVATAGALLVRRHGDASPVLAGTEVAATLRQGIPADHAYCPAKIKQTEGNIVDCVAQAGTSAPVLVRVTQDDGAGHFHYDVTRQAAPVGDRRLCGDLTPSTASSANGFRDLLFAEQAAKGEAQGQLALQMSAAMAPAKRAYATWRAAGCNDADLPVSNAVLSVLR